MARKNSWATVFALAEKLRASGKEAIEGFAVGYEVQSRLALAFTSAVQRGFLMAALAGTLGANDGIMRKDITTGKLTELEIKRNKKISKKRYIVEQYFGLSHLYDGAYRARFTTILKNIWDTICRQMAFNMFRGSKLVAHA